MKRFLFLLIIFSLIFIFGCGNFGENSASSESSSLNSFTESSSSENSSGSENSESSAASSEPESSDSSAPETDEKDPETVSAMWFSYLDFYSLLTGKSKAEFSQNIATAFDNCLSLGCNTVIVQVRPFSDALYHSDIFPWSSVASGTQGLALSYDPLDVMIEAAHSRNLKIEAWVNPFRVLNTSKLSSLSSLHPAWKWVGEGETVAVLSGSIFFNPASEEVRKLVVSGIEEIVNNYDVDGIHFDDYFYPNPDEDFDDEFYSEYLNSTSSEAPLSLGDWRRQNINLLIKDVYSAIKSIKPEVVFGISPQGNSYNNYNSQYIDIPFILSHEGYVDYIAPQIYFGINHGSRPFESTLQEFADMITVKGISLYAGLAAYKVGTVDNYAGSGKNEWIENTDILAKQIDIIQNSSVFNGYIYFRYNSLFAPATDVADAIKLEIENIKDIIRD